MNSEKNMPRLKQEAAPFRMEHDRYEPAARISDLAAEDFGFSAPVTGMKTSHSTSYGFPVMTSELSGGTYHTVVCGRIWEGDAMTRRALVQALAAQIGSFTKNRRRCLIAGIGNPDIPADALGSKICRRIIASHDSPSPVFVICPMTEARTGIDTAVYVRAIADAIHPDIIIAADALCARSRERLQTVVQISDCGITPGSALARTKGEISAATMPCPVVTIGVPTVISTASMDPEDDEPLLVTRAESDIITDCYASVIAAAVNTAIFGK